MRARYKAIVDDLALAIRSGALAPGTQLPTHRQLAADRRISLATATRVYQELGMMRQIASSGDIESLLRYQPHGGRLADRQQIAHHLRHRQLYVAAENVLIVSGAQHGLSVAMMSLLRPGDAVAVDSLTYRGAFQHHRQSAARAAPGAGFSQPAAAARGAAPDCSQHCVLPLFVGLMRQRMAHPQYNLFSLQLLLEPDQTFEKLLFFIFMQLICILSRVFLRRPASAKALT